MPVYLGSCGNAHGQRQHRELADNCAPCLATVYSIQYTVYSILCVRPLVLSRRNDAEYTPLLRPLHETKVCPGQKMVITPTEHWPVCGKLNTIRANDDGADGAASAASSGSPSPADAAPASLASVETRLRLRALDQLQRCGISDTSMRHQHVSTSAGETTH